MEPIESSETSAYINTLTSGTYPKEKKLQSKHGESLKSRMISFVFKSICFLFLAMCYFQLNLQSECSPRYFTTSVWSMIVWFMLTAGQWSFRRVNFMCDYLDSLTLIFHFFTPLSMMCKCSWRLSEAIVEWIRWWRNKPKKTNGKILCLKGKVLKCWINCRSHFQIVGAGRVPWSKFRTENLQLWTDLRTSLLSGVFCLMYVNKYIFARKGEKV